MAEPLPVNVTEYESLARDRIEPGAWGYIAGGANDEISLTRNVTAFRRLELLPRVLVDVTSVDTSVTLLGRSLATPVLIAPTGFQTLAHPDGEHATARAAAAAGTIMVLSTMSAFTIEEVSSAAPGPKWFQLYCYRDRSVTQRLVERAEAAGHEAICVTVDLPRVGRRERDVRSAFELPAAAQPRNFDGLIEQDAANADLEFSDYIATLVDPSLTWEIVAWLRTITSLPIILKGVHHPDDAALAVEHGVEGLIVSNHGGRQLDGVPATIDMLPAIVDAVRGAATVLLDGGIRRGTDVAKALALGADAVLIGRPMVWGLVVDGADGVRHVLDLLRDELELAMALLGCRSIAELGPHVIRPRP